MPFLVFGASGTFGADLRLQTCFYQITVIVTLRLQTELLGAWSQRIPNWAKARGWKTPIGILVQESHIPPDSIVLPVSTYTIFLFLP